MAKVFVIDDESEWLDLARYKLTELGHEVLTVDDCSEALRLLTNLRPDLIVLDLRMPVSGSTMLKALRENWPDIPVVLHTVYSGYRDSPELQETAGFATKDPTMAGLEIAINQILAAT